jgi:predicted dehydrogenase
LKPIRMGVVGVGHLGRFHAMNYMRIPDVQFVGVFDLNQDKAARVAEETQCRAFSSLEELLRHVDAVSLAVPTDRHHEAGIRILEKGIHCLIEKPIARDLSEADALIALAEKKGKILQVGHIERFNPAFRSISQTPLEPRFIESHRLSPFNPRGTEVSVVLDLMIHDIDIALHLVKSPVKDVRASGVAVVSDTIDIANARIGFENGCVANITASRISQKKMRKMRLFQKNTYVTVDFLEKTAEIYTLGQGEAGEWHVLAEIGVGNRKRQVVFQQPPIPPGDSLEKELEAFVKSVQGLSQDGVGGKEGRDALDVAIRVLNELEG